MMKDASKVFQLGMLAAALLTAFGPAHADSADEIAELTKPESSAQFGIGFMNHDAPISNQYTGTRNQGSYGLLDFNLVKRDDATGTWLKLDGRNLGLDNRELRVEHNKQGDWSYFAEYNQIVRNSPYTINTSATGVGTQNPAENGAAAPKHNEQLKTERQIASLGFDKQLPGGFSVQVRFRNEEKDGSRLFGRGVGNTTTIFLAEPINSTTRQFEAIIGYTDDKLLLSGGYYGTGYNNHNTAIWGTGGVAATPSPTALPPDNMSHQLFLSGNYTFTPLTRGNFKVAYGRATQNDGFIPAPDPANPNRTGKSSLEGRLDTRLIQFGLTSRPMPKLSLLANFRYDDRDDRTPIVRYGATPAGTSTFDGLYEPRSITTRAGKLEASYQLPMGYRMTGGYERDIKTRNVPTNNLAAVTPRNTTDEASYRLELRRSMSETLNGAVAYIHSDRGGSEILTLRTLNGAVGSSQIAPLNIANRTRDKIRLSADWTPLEPLSIQFAVESSDDSYDGRGFGLKDGKGENYSVDASYIFSEQWSATAWAARNVSSAKQTDCQGAAGTNGGACVAGLNQWSANLRDTGDAIGLGFRGQPKSWLQLGGDLSYSHDRSQYEVKQSIPVAGVTTPPDTNSTVIRLKFFGKYAVDKSSDVRIDLMHERRKTDDWTWANFTFNDGTTVSSNPNQNVTFLGATYIYKFQ